MWCKIAWGAILVSASEKTAFADFGRVLNERQYKIKSWSPKIHFQPLFGKCKI